ncbi:MAG: hypothetical protein NZ951_05825 [Dehalococcoidia bacterium]|nr:hypothetical protein [Dehalococcoidia bacterium]MDW8120422.1 hypothetical protein [Chloroflexota bacterium]
MRGGWLLLLGVILILTGLLLSSGFTARLVEILLRLIGFVLILVGVVAAAVGLWGVLSGRR